VADVWPPREVSLVLGDRPMCLDPLQEASRVFGDRVRGSTTMDRREGDPYGQQATGSPLRTGVQFALAHRCDSCKILIVRHKMIVRHTKMYGQTLPPLQCDTIFFMDRPLNSVAMWHPRLVPGAPTRRAPSIPRAPRAVMQPTPDPGSRPGRHRPAATVSALADMVAGLTLNPPATPPAPDAARPRLQDLPVELQGLVTENLGARGATALRATGLEFRAADELLSCRQLSKVEYPVRSAYRDQLLRWQDDQETTPMPPEGVLALAAPATRCLQGLHHSFEGVLPDGIRQIDPAAAAAFGRLRLSEHADLVDVQRVHAVAPMSLRQLRLLSVMTRTSDERLRIQDAWRGGMSWRVHDPIDLRQLGRLCEACLSLYLLRGGSFWLRMVGESLDTGGLERLLRIQPQGPRAHQGLRSVHGAGPPHWRGLELSLDYCRFPNWLAEPDGGTLRLAATICPVIRTTGQWQHGPPM